MVAEPAQCNRCAALGQACRQSTDHQGRPLRNLEKTMNRLNSATNSWLDNCNLSTVDSLHWQLWSAPTKCRNKSTFIRAPQSTFSHNAQLIIISISSSHLDCQHWKPQHLSLPCLWTQPLTWPRVGQQGDQSEPGSAALWCHPESGLWCAGCGHHVGWWSHTAFHPSAFGNPGNDTQIWGYRSRQVSISIRKTIWN